MAIFQIQRLQAEFENEDNHDFEVRLLYMDIHLQEVGYGMPLLL